jgi:hypothetical protein
VCFLQLLDWKPYKVANFPGLIALLTGVTMWSTSIQWVRRKRFELFFYTHQLYILFIICVALHVGDFTFSAAFSGIFLFAFDRFLRFCQSRSTVEVLSTKLLPCGVFELVLAKPQGMNIFHLITKIFKHGHGNTMIKTMKLEETILALCAKAATHNHMQCPHFYFWFVVFRFEVPCTEFCVPQCSKDIISSVAPI